MRDEVVNAWNGAFLLWCVSCRLELVRSGNSLECPRCGVCWPVTDGIPRFSSAPYFGEMSAQEMTALNDAVGAGRWLEVIRDRFEHCSPTMYGYIADLNRASWISLLPISPDATVLDLGSGLGAITHALALAYERVVSAEPVAERLRFTQLRLRQEGLTNVHLVQTTAGLLPFPPNTFDLVVLNGVLEWIGEWDPVGSPREAQLRFLRRVRELVKPTGIVVVGIENRVGFSYVLGRRDHNGLLFTSLMPRSVATAYLKLRSPAVHRTELNAQKSYRTYTYTGRGYRNLLAEARYSRPDFWWPDPGYNEPYELYRLDQPSEIRLHHRRQRNEADRVHGVSIRRLLKEWLLIRSGLCSFMAPDFLILAQKDGRKGHASASMGLPEAIMESLKTRVGTDPRALRVGTARCGSFRNKHTLKVTGADGTLVAVAKIANVCRAGAEEVERGFTNLTMVWRAGVGSPEPIDFIRLGNHIIAIESPARGISLEDLAMSPSYWRDPERVKHHLDLVKEWVVDLQSAAMTHFRGKVDRVVPAEWLTVGVEIPEGSECPWSVQHGDLYPGNVIVELSDRKISVIDWDEMAVGYPPLFDFLLAVTALYFPGDSSPKLSPQPWDERSLAASFCEVNWFSRHILECCKEICAVLRLPDINLQRYFLQYLSVRHHRSSRLAPGQTRERWARAFRDFYREVYEGRLHTIFEAGSMHSIPPSTRAAK